MQVGRVKHFYPKPSVAEIIIDAHEINAWDTMCIIWSLTGYVEFQIEEIRIDDKKTIEANKWDIVTIKTPTLVRENDKVSIIKPREIIK